MQQRFVNFHLYKDEVGTIEYILEEDLLIFVITLCYTNRDLLSISFSIRIN